MSIDEEKNILRKRFNKLNIDNIKRDKFSKLISKCLENTDEYRECRDLFIYVSKKNEVDTINIIKSSLENSMKVAIPLSDKTCNTINFFYIKSLNDTKLGAFNILEPNIDLCGQAIASRKTLCVVPSICYDKRGYRLGHGKGYYDRYLKKFIGKSIGICFDNAIIDELPINENDKKVDKIITESQIIKVV